MEGSRKVHGSFNEGSWKLGRCSSSITHFCALRVAEVPARKLAARLNHSGSRFSVSSRSESRESKQVSGTCAVRRSLSTLLLTTYYTYYLLLCGNRSARCRSSRYLLHTPHFPHFPHLLLFTLTTCYLLHLLLTTLTTYHLQHLLHSLLTTYHCRDRSAHRRSSRYILDLLGVLLTTLTTLTTYYTYNTYNTYYTYNAYYTYYVLLTTYYLCGDRSARCLSGRHASVACGRPLV